MYDPAPQPPPAPPVPAPVPERLLKLPEVLRRCGIGRSLLYKLMEAEGFPASVRVAANAVRWRESEVERWIAARPPAALTDPRLVRRRGQPVAARDVARKPPARVRRRRAN